MTFDDVLRDFDISPDEVSAWDVEDPILALAEQDPNGLFRAAARHLDDEPRSARYLVAVALGRAAEQGTESLARQAEELLLPALRSAPDRQVAEGVANALNHVWGRLDDGFGRQFELAADPDANCRLAAAQFLALATPEPPPQEVAAALARLAQDDDEDVRWWATEGGNQDD